MELPGILCYRDSTIRRATPIRAEFGVGGPFWARIYTGGRITAEVRCESEIRARKLFEFLWSGTTTRRRAE